MTDLDEALRADAQRWRAAQATDLNLDGLLTISMLTPPRHRRHSAIVVAAVAVVVATTGLVLALNRSHNHSPNGATTNHSVPSSSATSSSIPNTPPTPTSSAPTRLPGLGSPPPGQRTLLKSSGASDHTWTIAASTGRGELYAACIGGGKIKINMPGSGGFDLECTGMGSGASLPRLSTTVQVTDVNNQTWRVAVFGH